MNDLHVLEFARYLSYLEPFPPITKELDKWGSRYPSQKIHLCEWLEWQTHTHKGAYGRDRPNESAQTMYNRFLNPGGLLWLAEALGEQENTLRKAAANAIEAEKYNYRFRCVAFRNVIPWDRIMELFMYCDKWRYDSELKKLIVFNTETRLPEIKADSGALEKYNKVMKVERLIEYEAKKTKPPKLTRAEKKARGWEL